MRSGVPPLCAALLLAAGHGLLAGGSGRAFGRALDGGSGAGPDTAGAGPRLRIECPLLDGESRAALEARARAEMALTPLPIGEIAISCEVHLGRVGWRAADGRLRQRDVGIGSDTAAAVDSLLAAVHALRFGDGRVGMSTIQSRVDAAEVVATPGQAGDFPPPAPRPRVAPRPFRLAVLAGAHSELWEGSIAGSIEGQLGLRLSWRGPWALAVGGGLGRGLETGAGIRARTARAMASVGYVAGSHLELQLGGEWRTLDVAIPGASPATSRGMTGGIFGTIRYVASRGRFWFFAGPQLGLSAAAMVVQVSGREVFNVPRFMAGFSVAGAGDFIY